MPGRSPAFLGDKLPWLAQSLLLSVDIAQMVVPAGVTRPGGEDALYKPSQGRVFRRRMRLAEFAFRPSRRLRRRIGPNSILDISGYFAL